MVSRGELFAECRSLIAKRDEDTADFDTTCIFQDLLGEKNPLFQMKKPQRYALLQCAALRAIRCSICWDSGNSGAVISK